MSWIDYLIVVIPVIAVMGLGCYTRRFIRGVPDFLSAGRLCGRYIISVASVASALSIIGLVSYVEVHYKTGFALAFWNNLMLPFSVILGLSGFVTYRMRETRAMSLGQFLEIRYSRKLRIFAAALRSVAEMLANMIMPAIAARFFIYFLDLPFQVNLFGVRIPTFILLVILTLALAISIIWIGGYLAITITDSLQGLILYPLLVLFAIFILCKFSWNTEIIPVMMDRAAGESFLNPYDVQNLRDFNFFMLGVGIISLFLHRGSWTTGANTAARTAHEQKMAGLLGDWRGALNTIFYVLVAVGILTFLNHRDYSKDAHDTRRTLSSRVASEVAPTAKIRDNLIAATTRLPEQKHVIGVDPELSDQANMDTTYLDAAHQVLKNEPNGNAIFQEFRTLYHQMMMAISMRHMLPTGMLGLFCLLLVLAMISTDDSRIYSAASTIAQDVVLPLRKKPFTPAGHLAMIRWVSVGIGVFFFLGSFFMAQLDYIHLFVTVMTMMWTGGCGPVMIFGLYSRFGTTAGAWASLLSGMALSAGSIFLQRNWANIVYPWLEANEYVDAVGNFLGTVSGPLNPIVIWKMNPVKCPINSFEFSLIIMLITLSLYCIVSMLSCRKPFNLERMLHRGKYAIEGNKPIKSIWNLHTVWQKLIGITGEYTFGDKVIAWGLFVYSFIYQFGIAFVLVVVWNLVSPWPLEWWGYYFLIVMLVIPGIVAAITTVWFGIGGVRDMIQLFRDLRARTNVDILDDGRVEGNMSLADKAVIDSTESQ